MAVATDKKGELWVQWTHDAMSKYVIPEGKMDADEMAEDMADVTVKYADQMLEEYEDRFRWPGTRSEAQEAQGGGRGRQRQRGDGGLSHAQGRT